MPMLDRVTLWRRTTAFWTVLVAVVMWLVVSPPTKAAATTCPSDEFNGPALDSTKFDVFQGSPFIENGRLVLPGTPTTRVDVQSKRTCLYGVVSTEIRSTSWKPHDQPTDSSFGFEHFTGTNGACHYSVQMVANGHLAILRAVPDPGGGCSGDPALQHYARVNNWDQLRTAASLRVYMVWAPNFAALLVTNGLTAGIATYVGSTVPAVPLKIRLNADFGEVYRVGYLRGAYG